MAWLLGIDEAGYGPNLGPFVMSAVACRVPDALTAGDLWAPLEAAVRRGKGKRDTRLIVDDSKVVYSAVRGLGHLERGAFTLLDRRPGRLGELIDLLCADDAEEIGAEVWYTGATPLPGSVTIEELEPIRGAFAEACAAAGLCHWRARSAVVCPARFNAIVERTGTKGAVLAHAFIRLLGWGAAATADDEPLFVCTDKQGGRNTYAEQVQHALTAGLVVPVEETAARSRYRVVGGPRAVELTFRPGADGAHFCVALASMLSKYLRELLMGELNAFWQQHVPGLTPTAGYPGDAARFLEAIRPAALRLQVPEGALVQVSAVRART
jgi:hypothetical protein